MKFAVQSLRRRGGFTLTEVLLALAISAVTLGGTAAVSISLQRSFAAADYQMNAQNDQLRVLDYVARDLRMAAGVSILNNGAKASLALPASSPALVGLNLGPLLDVLGAAPTATPATARTVNYFVEGGQLIREADGAQTAVASTVADLRFTREGDFVATSILFTPRFSLSPTVAAQENTRVGNRVYLRGVAAAAN